MLEVLLTGKLFRDPKPGRTKTDKPMCSALVRVAMGEESIMASVLCFEDAAERLGRLKVGDAVSVAGTAKIGTWERDGEVRPSLDVVATAILTVHDAKKRRGDAPRNKAGNHGWDVYGDPVRP